jgi:hypothetical protein
VARKLTELKLALATCIVTAVASIAVAYIGVLPGLRGDDGKLKEKDQEVQDLRKRLQQLEALNGMVATETSVRWTISGSVRRAQNGREPGQYEVYLVPGNKYVALTSDDGRFAFDGLFPASYALVVRDVDSRSNRAARGLITPDDSAGTLDSPGAFVQYRVIPGVPSPEPRVAVLPLPDDGPAGGAVAVSAVVIPSVRAAAGERR